MKLRIIDDLGPEDLAMLQALYSRSPESVDVHLEKVKSTGSGKFMEKYYVGYSHKSIADCGTTTMFIEGVSLLAAKAVQDWPLYSGQETSTRYIDMSKQAIVDPFGSDASKAVLDRWMTFYVGKQGTVGEILRARYPMRNGEKQSSYDGAIKARTFDVLRGFLPAGITTQLSWHSNLRQAGDHLAQLIHHPASEISRLALALREQLGGRYPSSGLGLSLASVSGVDNKDRVARDVRQDWEWRVATEFTYSVRSSLQADEILGSVHGGLQMRGQSIESRYAEMLKTRPRGCVLPHFMTDLGQFTYEFLLDFGSFRDLQRHRNGVCRMPLLDTSWGFEPWYLEQLGDPTNGDVGGLRNEAVALIDEQRDAINRLGDGPDRSIVRQYYTALGFRVPCRVTYALPALLYVMELRSGKTVHPTLRRKVHGMIELFKRNYADIALHADMDPDDWDVRRGDQTITAKG
jgi:thymidylate synthase ThyX